MIQAVFARSDSGAFGLTTPEGVKRLPWPHLYTDMRRFKDLTRGTACLMGRATYETLPPNENGPLPGRGCFVASHSPSWDPAVHWITDVEGFLDSATQLNLPVSIIGGSHLLEETFSWVDVIHETVVLYEDQVPGSNVLAAPVIPASFAVSDSYVTQDGLTDIWTQFKTWRRISA